MFFQVDVAAIQEAHFLCKIDACVLSNNFVIYSIRRVSLLVKISLNTRIDVAFIVMGLVVVCCGQYCSEDWFISGLQSQ